MALTIGTFVILTSKSDWMPWFRQIKHQASRDNIWDYVNPELTEGDDGTLKVNVEPKKPQPGAVYSSQTPLPAGAAFSGLSEAELGQYLMLREDYKDDLREYEARHKAIYDLHTIIYTTINQTNYPLIMDCHSVYHQLKTLKQYLEPSRYQLKRFARTNYERAKNWPLKEKQDAWLRE
ncbi:uncharacterized protein BDR25DRAFT_239730, partial [Lindgomyces ingoldianus]